MTIKPKSFLRGKENPPTAIKDSSGEVARYPLPEKNSEKEITTKAKKVNIKVSTVLLSVKAQFNWK